MRPRSIAVRISGIVASTTENGSPAGAAEARRLPSGFAAASRTTKRRSASRTLEPRLIPIDSRKVFSFDSDPAGCLGSPPRPHSPHEPGWIQAAGHPATAGADGRGASRLGFTIIVDEGDPMCHLYVLALALALAVPSLATASGSAPMPMTGSDMQAPTPAQEAATYYNDGVA